MIWKNMGTLTPLEWLANKLHIMLGNLPFAIMKRLEKVCLIPKVTAKLPGLLPFPACLFEL